MIRLLRDVAVARVRVAEVFKDFGLSMPVCSLGEPFARVKALVALDHPNPLDRAHPLNALRQVILTPGIAAMTEASIDPRVHDIARVLAAGGEGRHKACLV